IDDCGKRFAGPRTQLACAEGKFHQTFEYSCGQRPVDLVEPDEEISYLGNDIRLSDIAAPAYDEIVVEEGISKGVLKRGEMTLRKLRISDLCKEIFVGAREQPDECVVVKRAGLARITGRFRFDAIEQAGRHLRRHFDPLFDQVPGYHGTGCTEICADVV